MLYAPYRSFLAPVGFSADLMLAASVWTWVDCPVNCSNMPGADLNGRARSPSAFWPYRWSLAGLDLGVWQEKSD